MYQEDGRDPIELMSWKGSTGAFSYRDRTGAGPDVWPVTANTASSQTPWVIRLETGNDETPTLVASVAGTHRRVLRMTDSFAGPPANP